MTSLTRREVLKTGAAATLTSFVPSYFPRMATGAETVSEKLPVAAVVTEYRPGCHADVILGKILEGYLLDGGIGPDLKLVSLYTDQVPPNDLSRGMAKKHGFPIAKSIDEAITRGTNQVQVAGVLSIGEHGEYPTTPDTKQYMYPRRRFFDEIVASFRRCGKSVPVFNDKHLAYRWDDAKFMYDTSRAMKFPLLAGSSLPVAMRVPPLDLPIDSEVEASLVVGYGGFEAYGFHALEAQQCLVERRRGGETGVASVQAVTGDAIRMAETEGRWSTELLAAALKTLPRMPTETEAWMMNNKSAAFLLTHRDGLKTAVIMANGLASDFAVAIKLKGRAEPVATWFKLEESPPNRHFSYLVHAIDQTIHSGKSAYPVERTLLTTGILDRVMQSLAQNGRSIETPELNVTYLPADWPFANHPKSTLKLPPY